MAKNTATRIGAGKNRSAYDLAHAAWRTGAIADFYYGRRSANDSTVIWQIDGLELGAKDHAQVVLRVTAALTRKGIASVAFGPAWCGYRSVIVSYANGATATERYDAATGRVVIESTNASAKRAA